MLAVVAVLDMVLLELVVREVAVMAHFIALMAELLEQQILEVVEVEGKMAQELRLLALAEVVL